MNKSEVPIVITGSDPESLATLKAALDDGTINRSEYEASRAITVLCLTLDLLGALRLGSPDVDQKQVSEAMVRHITALATLFEGSDDFTGCINEVANICGMTTKFIKKGSANAPN